MMNYSVIKKALSVEEIRQIAPLSKSDIKEIEQHRSEIKQILSGKNQRILIIVGPCSAWPSEAVIEYAKRLKHLAQEVNDVMKIVMRVYIQKPRTRKGWTGPINQPDPFSDPDIEAGVKYARKMMVEVVKMGLPIADEALFTHNAQGFMELLSWVAIGARSAEDQEHRIFASAVHCPVGLKNPTQGDLEIAVNSVIAAQSQHVALLDGNEVQTHGNDYAHLVLRGSKLGPNYSVEHLAQVNKLCDESSVRNPAVMIDLSHDNCIVNGKKEPLAQAENLLKIYESISHHKNLRKLVKGFMIESFLREGNQPLHASQHSEIQLDGLSITDPCLGWEATEKCLQTFADLIRAKVMSVNSEKRG